VGTSNIAKVYSVSPFTAIKISFWGGEGRELLHQNSWGPYVCIIYVKEPVLRYPSCQDSQNSSSSCANFIGAQLDYKMFALNQRFFPPWRRQHQNCWNLRHKGIQILASDILLKPGSIHVSNNQLNAQFLYSTGCPRRNVPNFGRVFLMLNYTDITQNTYVQSWRVTEIMAREVWNFDSCYTLTDYQIHIKTGRNMWFL